MNGGKIVQAGGQTLPRHGVAILNCYVTESNMYCLSLDDSFATRSFRNRSMIKTSIGHGENMWADGTLSVYSASAKQDHLHRSMEVDP